MLYVSFDPGDTTGVAWVDSTNDDYDCAQFKDPDKALKWVNQKLADHDGEFRAIVEQCTGGGSTPASKVRTIELVGWFTNFYRWFHNQDVYRPISQNRLSGLSKATELAKAINVEGPHSWDALAHCIVQARIHG